MCGFFGPLQTLQRSSELKSRSSFQKCVIRLMASLIRGRDAGALWDAQGGANFSLLLIRRMRRTHAVPPHVRASP